MKLTVLSALMVLASCASAHAQQDTSPLSIEGSEPVPLAGSSPASMARAGDTYLLSFALRNRASEPVWLRRIVLRLPDGLEVLDPNTDRIDNDRDGAVDEGDEAATDVEEAALAWRGIQTDPPLAPSEAAERAVKVRILPDAEAGSEPVLSIFAAASNGDLAIRNERDVAFSLVPPNLDLKMNSASTLRATETPNLTSSFIVPSGRIDDFMLAIKSSASVGAYRNARVEIGSGITCDNVSEPVASGHHLTVSLGTCVSDPATTEPARTIKLIAEATLKDADPFSGPNVINAARVVRISSVASSGDRPIIEPDSVVARIVGPLMGARLIKTPEDRVDAGDTMSMKYRLVNRGDASVRNLVLSVEDDGMIDCSSFEFERGSQPDDACADGARITGGLDAGELRDVGFSFRLRNDAILAGKTMVRASLSGNDILQTSMPDAPFALKLPSPPKLTVASDSEWRDRSGILTARIGDAAIVEISGTLPEGRYPASLRLMSRLVDAQTGEPVGPAPLLFSSFTIDAPNGPSKSEPVIATDDNWNVVSLTLDEITVAVGANGDDKRYTALVSVALRDQPEALAGRIVEITSELDLFDTQTVSGESWIEALIVEPALDLTLRSPDEDRSIELDTSAQVAALTCNRGMAAAHALVLGAHIPSGLVLDDDQPTRFIRVPHDSIGDSSKLFGIRVSELGEIDLDERNSILRGVMDGDRVLAPDTCAALVFSVRRSGQFDSSAALARIKASIEPFTGRTESGARIYSGLSGGEIRFTLPPVRFGPVSEIEIGLASVISHSILLEVPPGAGPYRLDLTTESADGLDWTILQVDDDGAASPWRNGSLVEARKTLRFRLEAPRPNKLPLGWIDTSLVRALLISSREEPIAVSTRLISRKNAVAGGKITVRKLLALDRDCDGNVDDERVQDALFEPVKDAAIGDCVIFRVIFRHAGDKSMEQIVVRDQVPLGTELRPNAVEILRAPEPSQNAEIMPPQAGERAVVWRFDGLFEPGTEGEVSYAVKLIGEASGTPK